MKGQPYAFEDVPDLSRAEARARETMARLVPDHEDQRFFRAALGKILQDLRGEDEPLSPAPGDQDGASGAPLSNRVTIRRSGLASDDDWTTGEYPVRMSFGLGGTSQRAIVEVPLSTGRSLIGRVVGVSPERLGASDLLTPVEQGILAYFAERISAGLCERVGFLAPLLPISLLDIATESAPIPWGSVGPAGWFAVSGSLHLVGMPVPFRLLLPWTVMEHARRRYDAGPEARDRARRRSIHLARPLGGLRVSLTGRLGTLSLTRPELAGVEVNDIVLLDETPPKLQLDDGRLGGSLRLAFEGRQESAGCIEVQVTSDATLLTVIVQHVLPGRDLDRGDRDGRVRIVDQNQRGPESTGVPEKAGDAATSPGSAEARALAEDAPVHLQVEIGRIRMTLRELSQLVPGSILELQKEPSAPVALVVEDRLVGRGELVRIEGELGVRILSLA